MDYLILCKSFFFSLALAHSAGLTVSNFLTIFQCGRQSGLLSIHILICCISHFPTVESIYKHLSMPHWPKKKRRWTQKTSFVLNLTTRKIKNGRIGLEYVLLYRNRIAMNSRRMNANLSWSGRKIFCSVRVMCARYNTYMPCIMLRIQIPNIIVCRML